MTCASNVGRRSTHCALLLSVFALAACPPAGSDMGPEVPPLPTARITTSVEVSVGLPSVLDGQASTDDLGPLTYLWSLSGPAGSAAEVSDESGAAPTFTPDVEGTYQVTLTVTNAAGESHTQVESITAVDRSTTETIDDAGGEVVSADGRLHIEIPAGALTGSVDVVITVAAPSQFPDAIFGAEIVDMEVFDVQPAGLTFATSAKASISLEAAYALEGGQWTASGGRLLSIDGPEAVPFPRMSLDPDPSDPSTGTLSGELDALGPVAVSGGLESRYRDAVVRADPPSEGQAGESFDITVTTFTDPLGLPPDQAAHLPPATPVAAQADDASVSPVQPDPAGATAATVTLSDQGDGSFSGVLDYWCESGGLGTWVSTVTLDEELDGGIGFSREFTIQAPIDCVAPVETSTREVGRATWISPGSDPDEILVGGLDPERWDVASGTVTSLEGGATAHHLHPVGAGLFSNIVEGASLSWTEGDGWQLLSMGPAYHAQQFAPGPDGRLYGSSGIQRPVIVHSDFAITEHPYDHVEAFWSDGSSGVLVQVSGDGNSSSNPAIVTTAAVEAGSPATTLTGDAMGEILDPHQRLNRDFTCLSPVDAPTGLVCVFTGGERDPGFLVENQEERDGYLSIFSVDLASGSATTLEEKRTPVVGATGFTEGGRSLIAFADQDANTLEFREVGFAGLTWSLSVDLGPSCANLFDFAVTPGGTYAVASCFGEDGPGGDDDRYVWVPVPPGG